MSSSPFGDGDAVRRRRAETVEEAVRSLGPGGETPPSDAA